MTQIFSGLAPGPVLKTLPDSDSGMRPAFGSDDILYWSVYEVFLRCFFFFCSTSTFVNQFVDARFQSQEILTPHTMPRFSIT